MGNALFGPLNAMRPALPCKGEKSLPDEIEEAWRQKAIADSRRICARDGPQVRSRPHKFVAFVKDNPRAFAIETEASFGLERYLDRGGWIGRHAVCDRQNRHMRIAVCIDQGKNDSAGAVLGAFLPSLLVFS